MTAVAFLLGAGLLVMIIKRILLIRELRRMTRTMERMRRSDSSPMLTVGTQNKDIAALAASINALYQEKQDARAEYIRQNQALRQSMADISHDLRTPLTAMLGYLRLLRRPDNPPDKQAEYLDIAYEKADGMHKLVNTLFDLARLESGEYQFIWETIDIKVLLEQELVSFYAWFSESGREPVIDISGDRMRIYADRTALQRVFANLIQNALRHSSGTVTVKAFCKKGTAYVWFSNHAPKLQQEDIPHLFERAFTVDRQRTSAGGGLGLAISKEFVEQMGGQIEAALNEGWLSIMLRFPVSGEEKESKP